MVKKADETNQGNRLDIFIHRNGIVRNDIEREGTGQIGLASHTGQDPRKRIEVERQEGSVVYGRSQHHALRRHAPHHLQRNVELEALDLFVDEKLLTGDLEEDISILSIVA